MRLIPTLFAMSLSFAVPAAAGPVSIDDLAFAKGIVKIEEVRLNHHGVWKVEGEDAASGAIIKLKRDD